MKLTKKQREEVVHLLRCAADCGNLYEALTAIADEVINGFVVNPSSELAEIHRLSYTARWAVEADFPAMPYEMQCLEAAARVKEGSWPCTKEHHR